jgi:hypothetical protein
VAEDWATERTDIKTALALQNQAMEGIRSDFAELRVYLVQVITDIRNELAEAKRSLGSVQVEHLARRDASVTIVDRVDKLEGRVGGLERAVSPLVFSNKIVVWVATALGGSFVALIWSLITGVVRLSSK